MNEQAPSKARVSGERFISAWIDLAHLPGGMMTSSSIGNFGPVAAMTSCLITTDESVMQRWVENGKPVIEIQLADSAPEPEPVPDVRQVLRRVLEAVQALGAMEDGKTLFESSPSKSKAAFDAWLMLNQAVAKANYVLEQPSQPPASEPLALEVLRALGDIASDFGGHIPADHVTRQLARVGLTVTPVEQPSQPPGPVPKWKVGDMVKLGPRSAEFEIIGMRIVCDIGVSGKRVAVYDQDELLPPASKDARAESEREVFNIVHRGGLGPTKCEDRSDG